MSKIATFLMFDGKAEEAVDSYVALFPDSHITGMVYHPAGTPMAGKVLRCSFVLNGIPFMASDSTVGHDFTFTPSMSIYMTCDDEAEFDVTFALLAEGGRIHMSPADYGFSRKFGWTADRFGVSWQLNLPDIAG